MNIRDVAEKAGISIATVSRYLNGGPISSETRKKVEEAIRLTNYVPNACARGIFVNKYNTIGLMLSNINNPFFTQLVSEIESYAYEKGYAIYLCNTNDDVEREKRYLNMLRGYRVDGIITSRTQCKDEYLGINIPVVSFENQISEDTCAVSTNNVKGGMIAADILLERGAKNLLHITGPNTFEAVTNRTLGFTSECQSRGVSFDIFELSSDFHGSIEDYHLFSEINWRMYDGVFVFNDIAAALVTKHLLNIGLNIPDDIMVVGYDNSFISSLVTPSLTTIDQPSKEIGRVLLDSLLALMKGEYVETNILIDPILIERESTKVRNH